MPVYYIRSVYHRCLARTDKERAYWYALELYYIKHLQTDYHADTFELETWRAIGEAWADEVIRELGATA